MRVLYIASNPDGEDELTLEREITELQRKTSQGSGVPVSFRFLPSLAVEDLPGEILKFRPTIVHLAAHGDEKELLLSNADGEQVAVTAELLSALLDVGVPPRLVYLNACNSGPIAKQITSVVPLAIGTTANITNRAARASTIIFYERLLNGGTVAQAHKTSSALLSALSDDKKTRSELFTGPAIDAAHTVLLEVPEIVARFPTSETKRGKLKISLSPSSYGDFDVEFGLIGCPPDTTQVVFFTDDDTFILEEEPDEWVESWRAEWLAHVVKGPPVRGTLWSEDGDASAGDFRIVAAGLTGDNRPFCTSTMICDALESYLAKGWYGPLKAADRTAIEKTIRLMRANDGSNRPSDGPPSRKPRKRPS